MGAWTFASLLTLAPFGVGYAQEVLSQTVLFDSVRVHQLQRENAAQLSSRVVVFDESKTQASIVLTNPTNNELTVSLGVRFYVVGTDSSGHFIPKIDTTSNTPSLVRWVRDLPSHVTLKPKASDTIVVRIDVPQSVITEQPKERREYWAQLIAASPSIQDSIPIIVQQWISNADSEPRFIQLPAHGNIKFPMESHVLLVYRTGPTQTDVAERRDTIDTPLQLGTPSVAITREGYVEWCSPLQITRKIVGMSSVHARARLWLALDGERDTLILTQPLDLPAGSGPEFRPCFRGPLPFAITKAGTVTLTIDGERNDSLDAVRMVFTPLKARATLTPGDTAKQTEAKRFANGRLSPDTGASPAIQPNERVRIVELLPLGGPLREQLRREVAVGDSAGKVTLVEVGASWCGPCRAFLRSLSDSVMIDALQDAHVVRIDFDLWGQSFIHERYPIPPSLPLFFIANADGSQGMAFDLTRWNALAQQYRTLDARVMGPPLKEFIGEASASTGRQ